MLGLLDHRTKITEALGETYESQRELIKGFLLSWQLWEGSFPVVLHRTLPTDSSQASLLRHGPGSPWLPLCICGPQQPASPFPPHGKPSGMVLVGRGWSWQCPCLRKCRRVQLRPEKLEPVLLLGTSFGLQCS